MPEPAPTRESLAVPRDRFRRWVVVAAVLCTVLAGCTDPTPPGPAGPDASGSPSPDTTSPAPVRGPWGAYGNREQACAGVAGDVVTLSLLTSSLPVSQRVAGVQQVEDEVEAMLEAAPPAVASPYARIQLAVDSYGEDLVVDAAPTATPAPSRAPAAEPRFDDLALQEALEQIRMWLTDTCQNRR
jgi:hypothetical protein